ncbi:MAG: DUF1501 domain-containing protein [Planctomycetaceae bacterium]|nr:DUF1501 domain-containing protein [Planctomycetaceae bacterium]
MTRRQILKMGLAASGMALIDPARLRGQELPLKARAKAVIQIWMWGGPSHLDTFDPKPDAGQDYCGPLKNPISTNIDGIRICELLPRLAKLADKYSIIRSMTHGNNAHETAAYLVQTGHEPGRLVYPSMGALVSLFKGYKQGYKGTVPPYIVLTRAQGRFSEAGFLGPAYKPFCTGGDPAKNPFAVEGIVAEGISEQRQLARRELLGSLDALGRAMPGNAHFAKFDQCQQEAYEMMLGQAKQLFDLSTEQDSVRDLYGRNSFGQSCLMARRLVERGVPYVTINYSGWDTHKQHFETMRRRLPEMDAGFAALLQDLSDRGLLDSTVIWWSGEFGRTPRIQWESPWNGGRGHYGKCFCAVVAGGGFKGGRVVGRSDEKGLEPAERPVKPNQLLASICTLLGIDPNAALSAGKDLKVMPLAEKEDLLTEIMQPR